MGRFNQKRRWMVKLHVSKSGSSVSIINNPFKKTTKHPKPTYRVKLKNIKTQNLSPFPKILSTEEGGRERERERERFDSVTGGL